MRIESINPFEYYACYKIFHKKEKRWYVQLVHKGNRTRTTITYGKFLLSNKLGRIISREEQVDHKDDNKLNDDIDNLQILTEEENKLKHSNTLNKDIVTLTCPCCKEEFTRERRQTHLVKGGSRTFCKKECFKRFFGHKS
jgi:hypothetical protein